MAAPRLKPHNPLELERLLEWVAGASSILEIGSRYGYTLVDIAHEMVPGAKVVSVDLPDQEGWNDPDAIFQLRANVARLVSEGYSAALIEGDSRSADVVARVKALAPFDVVFIDGDHTYEGVKQDWQNYGDLAPTVIFHDIRKPKPPEWMGLGVWQLWAEIRSFAHKSDTVTEEFLADGSKMGIGRVIRK